MNKNYLLLTGAGFSRNWGGWVSSEVYDYLLTTSEVIDDNDLKETLNLYKDNFEYALQTIQEESSQGELQQQRLDNLQRAIIKMFNTMDQAFLGKGSLCFVKDGSYTIEKFLERFNVIFTLNQDLLLERCYRRSLKQFHPQGQGPNQWHHHNFPGVVCIDNLNTFDFYSKSPPRYTYQSHTNFKLYPSEHQKFQPIIKLHGSSNWYHNNSAKQLLIMGGNKESAILTSPLLKWYQELLKEHLNKKNTKLMIIGYSFSDRHINSIIIEAIKSYSLELFVIAPSGSDVVKSKYIDEGNRAIIENAIVGVSSRRLDETFKDTGAEYLKINKFFEEVHFI